MKIALIGPGLMPIPPVGWGAIEILIWKYYKSLQEHGHDVTIFNSKNLKKVSEDINKGNFDFVHIHYDKYSSFFSRNLNKPFCITSHYGLILQKEKWSKGYFSIFADFFSAPAIISLSPSIKNLYINYGYKNPIYVLKNGMEVEEFDFKDVGNNRVLYLGKIEKRKRQAELSKILDNKIDIDFVGPISDNSFCEGQTTKYLGTWTKDQVKKNMTNYSTLLLLSEGEAAPLVVVEALAAGLSVVVSKSASANLVEHPFITILDDNEKDPEKIISSIKESLIKNTEYRKTVRRYALENFDNKIIMRDYFEIIEDFINKSKNIKMPMCIINNFIFKNLFKYIFSKIWLILSDISLLRIIFKKDA